jgi:hypothetical protein
MSASVTGFQLVSEKVVVGEVIVLSSMMAAKEEVTTTRRTVGAEWAMARRMEVVPRTAGSTSSFLGSAVLGARG